MLTVKSQTFWSKYYDSDLLDLLEYVPRGQD